MENAMEEQTMGRAADPAEIAWRGIELCREGDWKEGLYWLSLAAGAKSDGTDLPSVFYAYLGYGVAKYQNNVIEGLKLCRHAIELEFYQPENYYFLAQVQLLARDRRSAMASLERGLEVDSSFGGLLELKREMGERRPPVLPFLARENFLNRLLGKWRHRLLGARGEGREDDGSR